MALGIHSRNGPSVVLIIKLIEKAVMDSALFRRNRSGCFSHKAYETLALVHLVLDLVARRRLFSLVAEHRAGERQHHTEDRAVERPACNFTNFFVL